MKKVLLIVVGILVGLVALAQKEETRQLPSFDEVASAEAIEVILIQGPKESARILVNGARHDTEDVLTEVTDGKLKIHLKGSAHRNVAIAIYVTYNKLHGVQATSASKMSCQGKIHSSGTFQVKASSSATVALELETDRAEVSASSSANVSLQLSANKLEVAVSSAGDVALAGSVNTQEATVSSGGVYDGEDLMSENADVKVSSGGAMVIHVTKKLDALASSGGSGRYYGLPQYVNKLYSSGGSISGD